MSWRAQSRSKDAKTPSVGRAMSENPEPGLWPVQPYLLPAAYCLVHAARNKSARAGATAAGGRHGTRHRRRRCSAELDVGGVLRL
jgi:hypothetical protein